MDEKKLVKNYLTDVINNFAKNTVHATMQRQMGAQLHGDILIDRWSKK